MIHVEKNLAQEIAPVIKQAGAIVLSYFNTQLTRTEKVEHGVDNGFVTQADLASEKYLIETLHTLLPEAGFFAEESGKQGNITDYCWVIDPLDGTTNFAHGLPYFCVSVALTYKNVPVFGMIYQPITDELFWAIQGQGAFLNGTAVTISKAPFNQGVIALALPYAKDTGCKQLLSTSWQIEQAAYTVRILGAAALDIAYVAAGKMEGVILQELGWWDVAAGMILVQEAGGIVSDFQGKPVGPDYTSFIATGTQESYQKLLIFLK